MTDFGPFLALCVQKWNWTTLQSNCNYNLSYHICLKITTFLPPILGIAPDIQNTYFTGHPDKLKFWLKNKKNVDFIRINDYYWCITCTCLMKIVGETRLWELWKNRIFFVFLWLLSEIARYLDIQGLKHFFSVS